MKRVIGLDIVRFLAILFVFSVHYFLYTGFYNMNFDSPANISMIFFRFLFYTCVPLFLLLTGYLTSKAKVNRNYFYKIFRVLISYLIIAIIVLSFRIIYQHLDIGKLSIIYSLLSFDADPYAWYVEMYVGLFLLTPFLNIIYDNLNKKHKLYLIIIFLFLTSLAPVFNNLVIHGSTTNIFPDWWTSLYPITYFFIGRYLYEFPLKMSKVKQICVIISILLLHSTLMYLYCFHKTFDWGAFGGYNNLLTVIVAALILSVFYNVDIKNKFISKVITTVSKVSFEMYLISYIFDALYYSNISLNFDRTLNYLGNYFVYVPLVFISSFVCAYVINKVSGFVFKKLKPLYEKCIDIVFHNKRAKSIIE